MIISILPVFMVVTVFWIRLYAHNGYSYSYYSVVIYKSVNNTCDRIFLRCILIFFLPNPVPCIKYNNNNYF